MKLSVKAIAGAAALTWGLTVFLVGVGGLIWEGYGAAFLDMVASIYPGYADTTGFAAVIVATLYALLDGAVGGAVFAWIHNKIVAPATAPPAGGPAG